MEAIQYKDWVYSCMIEIFTVNVLVNHYLHPHHQLTAQAYVCINSNVTPTNFELIEDDVHSLVETVNTRISSGSPMEPSERMTSLTMFCVSLTGYC